MNKALSSIGGLFVKRVDVPEDNKKVEQKITSVASFQQQTTQTTNIIGQKDKAIEDQLITALEQANLPGFDYFEFARALQAQESIIPAENVRFQSSFTMATSMGVSADTLISSANHYLDVLKKKEEEFLKALEQHTGKEVVEKEQSAATIDKQIEEKSLTIKQLTDDINNLHKQKLEIQNQVATSRGEIERIKNNFYATLKIFVDKISSDIAKMKQYLSTVTGGK
jgi:archaellum component FlaC